MRPVEQPVTVDEPGWGGDRRTRTTHPAFGQIVASRVSGRMNLYGSDFSHNGYITITVRESELLRDLSHDWHAAGNQLIELSLSEAQWATFVSAMNIGQGVPCTLEQHGRQLMPMLPDPLPRDAQFAEELREAARESLNTLRDLAALVEGMGLPKEKTITILEHVRQAHQAIASNVPFVATTFDKHVEQTVEHAKVEIHGYMTSAIQRAGMTAIANQEMPLLLPAGDVLTEDE